MAAEALEKAKSFIGEDRVSRAFLTGEGETPVPVWEITCFTDDGILVLAVNTFFPGFFTEMFNSMKTKLNGNW